MAELKWICLSFSLTQLLSFAVGSLNINEKWFSRHHFGYDGGFCLPGICIGGVGDANVHLGAGGVHLDVGSSGTYLGSRGDDTYLEGGDDGNYFGGREDDDDFEGHGDSPRMGSGGDYTHLPGAGSGCGWSGSNSNYCSGGVPGFGGGGAGYRETMYCKPVACASGSCSGLHVHLDKGLYRSLVSKNAAKFKEAKHSMSTTDHMPETFKQNDNNVNEAVMAPESN